MPDVLFPIWSALKSTRNQHLHKPRALPLLILFLVLSTLLTGQTINFQVTSSSDTLLEGHVLQLNCVLENIETENFENPQVSGLIPISAPQQSTSIQIMNGVTTRQTKITYLYMAEKAGKWVIEPLQVQTKDGKISSRRLSGRILPNPGELPDPRFPHIRKPDLRPKQPADEPRWKHNRKSYRL
jgi:hypothetical protein